MDCFASLAMTVRLPSTPRKAQVTRFFAWRTCLLAPARTIATEAGYEQDEPVTSLQQQIIFGARAGMNFPSLFSPLKVGPYHLKHRVAMAPLTRMRAARPSHAPRPLNAEYYAQRATPGGLIIAEASPVVATGVGNPGVPGVWSAEQVEGWREVVDAVVPRAA
jgi:hypothetical protein